MFVKKNIMAKGSEAEVVFYHHCYLVEFACTLTELRRRGSPPPPSQKTQYFAPVMYVLMSGKTKMMMYFQALHFLLTVTISRSIQDVSCVTMKRH